MSANELNIPVSENFKKQATKAIFSIVLFAVVYLLLIAAAIALTIACGYFGIVIIAARPSFLTIMLGIGLIGLGVLVLIFLLKFIFSANSKDDSGMLQIEKEDEPELFEAIGDIVAKVKTHFPKKIFLVPDVNAFVFYNSNFWSMFLPVKKNLAIGMGLVNAVTVQELKAILSHEFGHFSQRSMKVGSFVYNVNKIIHNMLYDNNSYSSLASGFASISGYFAFFTSIAIRIVEGIQYILRKVYNVVNLNYMGLSREMEFHADAVAASVAGSKPLAVSLQRLELADTAYNAVINYYNGKINDAVKTNDIYPNFRHALTHTGKSNAIPFENNLPQVPAAYASKFNKSKLQINNQWASHPATEDRVAALEKINMQVDPVDNRPAIILFRQPEKWQQQITGTLFSSVQYNKEATIQTANEFVEDYQRKYNENNFDPIFNNYYDNKNPVEITDEISISKEYNDIKEIFGSEAIDLVYTNTALEADINTLKQIETGLYDIKSIDYDGEKYKKSDIGSLIKMLEQKNSELKNRIALHDGQIHNFFKNLANEKGKLIEFEDTYQSFIAVDKGFDELMKPYLTLMTNTAFIQEQTPFEIIEQKMGPLKESEEAFKEAILNLSANPAYARAFDTNTKEVFDKYLEKDHSYFTKPDYDDYALKTLVNAMDHYRYVLAQAYFLAKKSFLDLEAGLVK